MACQWGPDALQTLGGSHVWHIWLPKHFLHENLSWLSTEFGIACTFSNMVWIYCTTSDIGPANSSSSFDYASMLEGFVYIYEVELCQPQTPTLKRLRSKWEFKAHILLNPVPWSYMAWVPTITLGSSQINSLFNLYEGWVFMNTQVSSLCHTSTYSYAFIHTTLIDSTLLYPLMASNSS